MLGDILKDITVEEFLDRYYLKSPYLQKNGAETLAHLGTRRVLDALVARPQCEVTIVGKGAEWIRESQDPSVRIEELHSEGCCLLLRQVEKHDRGFARLAKSFRKDLHSPVGIALESTPAGACGLGWHYDPEELFIVQTEGSTELAFRKSTTDPCPMSIDLPGVPHDKNETGPVATCNLERGDWLYLPAGYWRKGEALEDSVILSVGITAPTTLKIYDFLKQYLLKSLVWRQRLPAFGGGEVEIPGKVLFGSGAKINETAVDAGFR